MDPNTVFAGQRQARIAANASNEPLQQAGDTFLRTSLEAKYSYNFSWMGRPVIQYPQDLVALQEIIFEIKPDLIIDVGVAHGGSVIFFASMLELLGGERNVVGIDVDIRSHNRTEIEASDVAQRINLIEGSSIDTAVVARIAQMASSAKTVLVSLDSNHTHAHVTRELELYAPFVTQGSYAVVFDGIIEMMPPEFSADRPWGPGNNPLTGVREFLASNPSFEVDEEIENKLVVTAAPSGYLKRVR